MNATERDMTSAGNNNEKATFVSDFDQLEEKKEQRPFFFQAGQGKVLDNFIVKKILYWKEINQFQEKTRLLDGLEFIDEIFEELEISSLIPDRMLQRIPSSGGVLVVMNQPFGLLEHFLIGQAIGRIRRDIAFAGNALIDRHPQFRDLTIVNELSEPTALHESITSALKSGMVVVYAPSGDLARQRPGLIKDRSWPSGLATVIQNSGALTLPVFIHGKLAFSTMLLTAFSKSFRQLLPLRELFKKKNTNISLTIGNSIPAQSISAMKKSVAIKLLQKHLIKIGQNKKGLFKTEKSVVHPVSRGLLKADIHKGELLGKTEDGKKIFLCDYLSSSSLMREIGRLRELTFRKMQEGTGTRIDLDHYDTHYKHLVLWDEEQLELVGAYRLGLCQKKAGFDGDHLYTKSLFHFSESFQEILPNAVEVGRSFVQEKYWNSLALDYLWQGIGAFLANRPYIQYLFGPVSISPLYSQSAQELIIYYYRKWYSIKEYQAKSEHPFVFSPAREIELANIFQSSNAKEDFKTLKQQMKMQGLSVPTLYKQYIDLCEAGGAGFLDFGIDEDFGGCVDGFILVNIDTIKEKKRNRYILANLPAEKEWRGFTNGQSVEMTA